jgi:uncharacterized protein
MDWKDLELSDKELIDSFLKYNNSEASELTFTNLFLWRAGYDIRIKIVDDFLCIRHLDIMRQPMLFIPLGKGNPCKVIVDLMKEMNERTFPLQMSPMTKEQIDSVMSCMSDTFNYYSEPDHTDYIYSIQDLINLPGRKFHDKKNMVNRFIRDNKFEYLPITEDLLDDVTAAAEEWCELKNCENFADLEHEKEGIFECLENFRELDCDGGVIRVEGKIIAFTFGEALTDDMVVIHIEKADPRIPGSYQIINQQYLFHRWADYKWVNREGDMGIEGLKKAKLSYNPIRMIEKYGLKQIRK